MEKTGLRYKICVRMGPHLAACPLSFVLAGVDGAGVLVNSFPEVEHFMCDGGDTLHGPLYANCKFKKF